MAAKNYSNLYVDYFRINRANFFHFQLSHFFHFLKIVGSNKKTREQSNKYLASPRNSATFIREISITKISAESNS